MPLPRENNILRRHFFLRTTILQSSRLFRTATTSPYFCSKGGWRPPRPPMPGSRVWHVFCCRMSFDDFAKHFEFTQICSLSRDTSTKNKYHLTQHRGSWKKGQNAGGYHKHRGQKTHQCFTPTTDVRSVYIALVRFSLVISK